MFHIIITFHVSVNTRHAIVQWLCGVVAGLLHYLFLCVFCWMLAEGIMLYILFIKVFGFRKVSAWYFAPLGWGE